MATKEQLLKVLKDILVSDGHVNANDDLNMKTDLIRNLGLSEIEFSVILCRFYENYKDAMPEDELYSYSEKHSRVEQIVDWMYRWTGKK